MLYILHLTGVRGEGEGNEDDSAKIDPHCVKCSAHVHIFISIKGGKNVM